MAVRHQVSPGWCEFYNNPPWDSQPIVLEDKYCEVCRMKKEPGIMTPTNAQGGASVETDPNGISAGVPGAKLDSGKAPVARGCLHYFPKALVAVAHLSAIGAKKYSWKGWASVPDGVNRYGDALARHELKINADFGRRDPDTGVLELTAVAWNALARLEKYLMENPDAGEA